MLYGNSIHFQYQKHVWGNKPCKWGRDILFNCIFWTLGQCFISDESIKWVSLSCSLKAIRHILTSLFTQNRTQLAIRERQQTRGSKLEMMRHPALQPALWMERGQGALDKNCCPSPSGEAALPSCSLLSVQICACGKTAQTCWLLMAIAWSQEHRVKGSQG